MSKIIGAYIVGIAALFVGAWALVDGNQSVPVAPVLGGVSNFDQVDAADGFSVDGTTVISGSGALTIGANGSTINELQMTTCDLYIGAGVSVTATSTRTQTCPVTGIASGDVVLAQFATSTANGTGWVILGANALDGIVSVQFANLTGTAAALPAALASSTRILYIDN